MSTELSIEVTVPRHDDGELLGNYDATLLRVLTVDPDKSHNAYVVRFEDGHQAAVLRREIRATARNWSMIDSLDRDAS